MIERVIRDVLTKLPGAEHRPQQFEMARLIEKAIATGRHALIEAGTGSGKSFGYLLPVLESGKKIPADAVMYSTDYPHSVSLWPHSASSVAQLTDGMDDEARQKVLAGNAVRVYRLNG